MDPDEDIIDVLYNKAEDEIDANTTVNGKRRGTLQRQASIQTYGFAYTHPPSRNYYEDLFQIQRRNFHGSDSVFGQSFERRSLSRTDSLSQVSKEKHMCLEFKQYFWSELQEIFCRSESTAYQNLLE